MLLGYTNTKSTYDLETSEKLGAKLYRLNQKEMAEKFPYLSTKDNNIGIYMSKKSGYINPRQMLKAAKTIG